MKSFLNIALNLYSINLGPNNLIFNKCKNSSSRVIEAKEISYFDIILFNY
jgi:hypothetical protein